jgi:hypothetical protein
MYSYTLHERLNFRFEEVVLVIHRFWEHENKHVFAVNDRRKEFRGIKRMLDGFGYVSVYLLSVFLSGADSNRIAIFVVITNYKPEFNLLDFYIVIRT